MLIMLINATPAKKLISTKYRVYVSVYLATYGQ